MRLLWISALALALHGQQPTHRVVDPARIPARNPYTSANDIAAGKLLFVGRCAVCHGQAGEGGRGPALRPGHADRDLFLIIRKGIPNSEMPAWLRQTDQEIWSIVAFIQQLGQQGGPAETFRGDATVGKAVFDNQSCGVCHRIDGEGADVGPDLSHAGVRSFAYLKESILNPNAEIPVDYLGATVTTIAGSTVHGILLGEDDYSIQLRDMSGRPRSFLKSQLKSFQHDTDSPMPAYTMPSTDLDNLVAYLKSKR